MPEPRRLFVRLAAPLTPLLLVAALQARAQSPVAATATAEASAARWQLAPIRWGGALGLSFEHRDFEEQPRIRQLSEQLTLEAASYLWQPWFVQLAGGLGLFLSQERESAVAGRSGRSVNDRGMTGRFEVDVFPLSHFPFNLDFEVNDSRTSDELSGTDYRSTRLGLRQNYTSVGGGARYAASFTRSVLDSKVFGRDRVDVLDGSANYQWERHQLQVSAVFSENDRTRDVLGSRLGRLALLHNYRRGSGLSVDSMASINRDERRFAAGDTGLSVFGLRQLTSFLNWRPDEESPLTVVASARLADADITSGGTTTNSRSASLNSSANYRFNQNLNAYASLGAATFEVDGGRQTLGTQAIGAQLQSDPLRWGPASYTARAGIAAAIQTGGAEGAQRLGSVTAGHELSTVLPAGASAFAFSIGQSGSASEDSLLGSSQTIAHTGAVSWRYVGEQGITGFAGISVGDSRTTGRSPADFSILNVQLSGQWRHGQYSSFSANLTWQQTRQSLADFPQPRDQRYLSGTATYEHRRVFGVPRLRYSAQFSAYDDDIDSRLQGNPNALRDQASWAFEQRLEHQIGRLESRLIVRVAQVDGKKNASLMASVRRRFGF